MNKKIVMGLLLCLSIAMNLTWGMASQASEVQADLAEEKLLEEKLLAVEVEGDTHAWDALSALMRPEFKAIVEQEYSKQDLATACKALQQPTDRDYGAYQGFMSYVELNGPSGSRPYSFMDQNVEQVLTSRLVGASLYKGRNCEAAANQTRDYKKSRRHVWLERLVLVQSAVVAPLIIFAFVYGFQDKHTCRF